MCWVKHSWNKSKLRCHSWTAHTVITPGWPWQVKVCWPIPHTVCAPAFAFTGNWFGFFCLETTLFSMVCHHSHSFSHSFPPSSSSLLIFSIYGSLKNLRKTTKGFYWKLRQEGIPLLSSLSNGQCTCFTVEWKHVWYHHRKWKRDKRSRSGKWFITLGCYSAAADCSVVWCNQRFRV